MKPFKEIQIQKNQNQIIEHKDESDIKCQESKMNIEVEDSNQLKYSSSTQASNNNNNNNSIVEPKNLNLNICNTNIIFFPEKNHIQVDIPEKEIFKFNFKSTEEYVAYSG